MTRDWHGYKGFAFVGVLCAWWVGACGSGFGFTGGHFFAHWQNDSFRQLMANAVLWTAR